MSEFQNIPNVQSDIPPCLLCHPGGPNVLPRMDLLLLRMFLLQKIAHIQQFIILRTAGKIVFSPVCDCIIIGRRAAVFRVPHIPDAAANQTCCPSWGARRAQKKNRLSIVQQTDLVRHEKFPA